MTDFDAVDQALHRSWLGMLRRCHGAKPDPRCEGISVHEAWRNNYRAFRDYVNHELGKRPGGAYLKRIDTKGDFAPGNLQWADPKVVPLSSTEDEPAKVGANLTADGRWRARLTLGTYPTEAEALSVAEDVRAFMAENYKP